MAGMGGGLGSAALGRPPAGSEQLVLSEVVRDGDKSLGLGCGASERRPRRAQAAVC